MIGLPVFSASAHFDTTAVLEALSTDFAAMASKSALAPELSVASECFEAVTHETGAS